MKNYLSLLLLVFFFTLGHSQSQDLAALTNNSTYISQNSIFNQDGSLYGTIFFFNKDKIDKNNWKNEYIIFDKNLNKIASQEFIQKKYGSYVSEKYYRCKKMGDHLLLHIGYDYLKGVEWGNVALNPHELVSSYRDISLKDNMISDEFYFDGNAFLPLKVEDNDLKKSFKNENNIFEIYPIDNKQYSGYLVSETSKDDKLNYKINRIQFFDLNKKPTWNYEFNQNATNKNYQEVITVSYPDDKAIIKMANYEKNKLAGFNIISVDLKTGKKDFNYELENNKSEFSHTVVIKKFDNKIYIIGQYSKYGKRSYYTDAIGLYRIELDGKGTEISRKYQPWKSAEPFIKIKKDGLLEDGYMMAFKDYLIFRDGSISYLTEKFKTGGQYSSAKTSDMIMLNFDSKFDVKGVQIIEKKKSKGYESDFLFNQYVKENTGTVFFFHDYKEDPSDGKKKWFLGINKFIDGNYSYDEIPILSKKDQFEISVYPAKEGYVQLREYNEKEKYNQIRLEKLNY